MFRLLVAVVALVATAVTASAQPCPNCPNGRCGAPQASAPLFQPVSYAQSMPTACYAPGQAPCPAGVCANCPCAAGSCPAACPAATAPAGRSYLFPRAHAILSHRPRLIFR